MQTKTIQQNVLPLLPKQITRNCSLCRGTIYIGLLHIIPVSISVLLNCLGGAGAVTPHWKAACAHWPWCPGSKHSQCPGSDQALQAHGQLQGTVTLTTLQAPAAACCHAPKQPLSTAPRHQAELTACLLVAIITPGFSANYDGVHGLTCILWLSRVLVFAR